MQEITVWKDGVGGLCIWLGWLHWCQLTDKDLYTGPDYYIEKSTEFLERCVEVSNDSKIMRIEPGEMTWTVIDRLGGE